MTFLVRYKKPTHLDEMFPDVDSFKVECRFSFDGTSFIGAREVRFISSGKDLDCEMVLRGRVDRMQALLTELNSMQFEVEAKYQFERRTYVRSGASEPYDDWRDRRADA